MKKIWKKVVAVSMAAVLMCGCGTGSGAQTGSQEEQGAVQAPRQRKMPAVIHPMRPPCSIRNI